MSRYVTIDLTEQQAQALEYLASEGIGSADSLLMDQREIDVAERALVALREAIHGVEPAPKVEDGGE